MNNALPVLLMLSLSMDACAQKVSEADVPQPVRTAFIKQFPKAEHARWEMETKTEYEVNFKVEGSDRSATYTKDGAWLETEHTIKADALPQPVRNAIAADYADQKVKAIEVAETPKGTVYEVDMEKGEKSVEVVFSADGKVVETKVEEDGEKGEEKD